MSCQISEKKKHEKNIDYYLNWHWQDKSSLLGAYVLWYKFPGNKKTKTANFFFSEPGKGCIGCCVLNKKTCDLAGGGGYCRRFVGNPLKHLWGAVSFSFNSDLFQTHTAKKKKTSPKHQGDETPSVKAKSKSQPVSTQHCSTLQHLVWLNPFWPVRLLTFVGESRDAFHIPKYLGWNHVGKCKNNLEHQKPTHTQWYSVSKAIVPLFVLTFSIG